jgi:hypothetical protein
MIPQILPDEIGDPDAEREAGAIEFGHFIAAAQHAGQGIALLVAVGLGMLALADIARGFGL